MERIGAVQLGKLTDKTFLTGIIPNGWEEKVYEHNTFWACKCKRKGDYENKTWLDKEIEFKEVCKKTEVELGERLMEIYSIEGEGTHFVVYLKRK